MLNNCIAPTSIRGRVLGRTQPLTFGVILIQFALLCRIVSVPLHPRASGFPASRGIPTCQSTAVQTAHKTDSHTDQFHSPWPFQPWSRQWSWILLPSQYRRRANTPKGCCRSAVMLSLIQMAIENDLDLYKYLTWLMKTAKDADLSQEDAVHSLLQWNAPTECKTK